MNIIKITKIETKEKNPRAVAIITTGEVIRKKDGTYSTSIKENDDYIAELRRIAESKEVKMDIYVPGDNNLMSVNYGFSRSHTPRQKAEMIFNTINNGDISDIYITGGSGTEDVVFELENMPPLLVREPKPNIYGMSDAQQLLSYLGQRGVVNPYMMANSPEGLIRDVLLSKKLFLQENVITKVKNIGVDILNGILIPCDLTREYRTPSELKFVQGKVNFIIDELRFRCDNNMMQMLLYGLIDKKTKKLKPEYEKQIVFCLSANPKAKEEQDRFKDWCEKVGIVVIENLRFGHQRGERDTLPLFAECELRGDELIIKNKSCINTRTQFIPLPKCDFFKREEEISVINRYNRSGGRFLFDNYNIKPNKDGLIEVIGLTNLQDIEIFLKELDKLKIVGVRKVKITPLENSMEYSEKQAREVIGYCLKTRDSLKNVHILVAGVIKAGIKVSNEFYLNKLGEITLEGTSAKSDKDFLLEK